MAKSSKVLRGVDRVATLVVRVVLVLLLIFLVLMGLLIFSLSWTWPPTPIPNPSAAFTKMTGLEWPKSAIVDRADDSHSTSFMSSEGEWILEFTAKPEDLKEWLAAKPPWGGDKWQEGKVPDSVHDVSNPSIAVFSAYGLLSAEASGPESIRWHNGRSLTADLTTGKVKLMDWDY